MALKLSAGETGSRAWIRIELEDPKPEARQEVLKLAEAIRRLLERHS